MFTKTVKKNIAFVAAMFALAIGFAYCLTLHTIPEVQATQISPCNETVTMADGTEEQLAMPGCEEEYWKKYGNVATQ